VTGKDTSTADATVTMPGATFEAIVLGRVAISDAIRSGDTRLTGDPGRVTQLFGLFDNFEASFPVVEPGGVR